MDSSADEPSPGPTTAALPPNHHGDHPGFRGPVSYLIGLSMVAAHRHDAELVCDLTGVGAGDTVVDVGCGPGTAARVAARRGAAVTGVDPSPAMLRLARLLTAVQPWRRRGPVTWVRAGVEAMPVEDGSTSICWSLAAVHHWPHLEEGLGEVHRILRPGGTFLALERLTEPGATGMASHGWTPDQADAFARLLTDRGFADPRVERHRVGRDRKVVTVIATRP